MSRSNSSGARRPATKFPQLQKQMQKNAVVKNLLAKESKSGMNLPGKKSKGKTQ